MKAARSILVALTNVGSAAVTNVSFFLLCLVAVVTDAWVKGVILTRLGDAVTGVTDDGTAHLGTEEGEEDERDVALRVELEPCIDASQDCL